MQVEYSQIQKENKVLININDNIMLLQKSSNFTLNSAAPPVALSVQTYIMQKAYYININSAQFSAIKVTYDQISTLTSNN